ncbi:MAG: response regulator transcription factor [Ardenticatenaceae bacterium]
MKTILIVEDDAHLREIISFNLDLEGREVLECANGPDALALLNEKGRQINLVVLDLGLPAMSGFEVAQRIKSDPILKSIPILLCTGKPPTKIIEGMHAGADDFIRKPFSIERDLLLRINVLLNSPA